VKSNSFTKNERNKENFAESSASQNRVNDIKHVIFINVEVVAFKHLAE